MNRLPTSFPPAPGDIHVMALVKGRERYVFVYDDAHRAETLRTLAKWAKESELALDWLDAATLSQRIRKENVQTL